jgi:hypothetical protein
MGLTVLSPGGCSGTKSRGEAAGGDPGLLQVSAKGDFSSIPATLVWQRICRNLEKANGQGRVYVSEGPRTPSSGVVGAPGITSMLLRVCNFGKLGGGEFLWF